MITTVFNFLQGAVEFSLLGCAEAASLAFLLYLLYAKTRAPAIIAGIFPNLNLNLNYYRSSLLNDFLITIRSGSKTEPKRENALAHGVGTQNMLELTPHSGRKPYNSIFDWGVYFPYVAQAKRSKKFQYPQVSSLVQKDPILQRAIKQAAEQILREQQLLKECAENEDLNDNKKANADGSKSPSEQDDSQDYQNIINRQERRAISILKDMRSTLNNFLLAFTSWLLYKLLPCFLSGVVTHTQQIEMLKAASEKAPGIPLIFLPLHRSHLDYIMVTFILTNNDIRSPLVAAGNNLQIPVFGELLRGLGAFFIKRKIDPVVGKKDILYRAILHLYLQHALKMGHNVEFFIEGGRTRTGKPCMPKGGILSVIVNAFMDRSIPDALLVPVSVNYEKIVDGNFVREQKGEKKVPESFGNAISGIWKALNSKYGLMRIDFNEPYSIKELVQSYNKIAKEDGTLKIYKPSARTLQHNQSTSSLYGTDVVCEEHRNLIDSISRQVVFDCAAATSVMSTNALAFLLLTRYRHGATSHEIAKGLDDLRSTLKGRKDLGFSGDSLHIINYATDLLGENLVQRANNDIGEMIIRPKGSIESWIELAYYSNMLTPHFALQSIVLTTFHNLLPKKTEVSEEQFKKNGPGIARKKLIETALENCEIYRYEYILNKPTQNLENMLEAALDELLMQNLIKPAQIDEQTEGTVETRRMARAIATYIESNDMDDDYDEENEILTNNYVNAEQDEPDLFLNKETIVQQKALCEVLAPFAQTYLCVVESLFILYKNSMLETDFIKFVMKELNNKVNTHKCPYAESISTDSVRNCLKVLEKWYVIEISNQCGLRLLALGTLYETSRDSLKNIVQRITNIVPLYNNGYF
ncbi:glycerol-3-phosphate acyltransferase 1, mitochondrial isoform X1 [Lucilia cuprina]|uniref:glycerol-3-phosphate acyltransferase 1, mitochondrial isoform X1 n=1 Tax=Lucilia cuprina TaxID=7375 RepID=UPI001F06D205|nr:glycerol-3-phosphate acyltransferase 1, mitochondrial isoform X1 [Lucilia cuprina]XP_046806759.1 glycerol-3-phosphate acyltransferase 1, mitochondrial isoform X1 [Lucilia cuprina]XP_046806760.1 glycerol-3-phosphate acyltransferase 1, mitochondrial isoform X1 [Lucilia cuprina]XP_046806761.1 glycerol-3-phosphate acyltransferase 1, mitochondrial isoform X1 [Lucilia cuprina]